MWLMLQQDEPGDYVIGTGVSHSVRDIVERAFACVGLDPAEYVRQDPELTRPADIEEVVADPSQGEAGARLGGADRLRRADRDDGRGRSQRGFGAGPVPSPAAPTVPGPDSRPDRLRQQPDQPAARAEQRVDQLESDPPRCAG